MVLDITIYVYDLKSSCKPEGRQAIHQSVTNRLDTAQYLHRRPIVMPINPARLSPRIRHSCSTSTFRMPICVVQICILESTSQSCLELQHMFRFSGCFLLDHSTIRHFRPTRFSMLS